MATVNSGSIFCFVIFVTCCIALTVSEPLRFKPHDVEPQEDWAYVDVRENAHMFYWLYYTTNTKGFQDTPLVMWLQGGPGGSGTGFGNFGEIGPLDVELNPRNTTWLQSASLLFVDNPVGTGFSYVSDKSAFTHNVQEIAADMMVLLNTFFMEKQTDFQTVPFYIFSESYGGKMTAAISQALYQAIQGGSIKCNFKGLAMGDSWISPIDSTLTWAPYLYVNSLVDQSGYDAVNKSAQRVKANIDAGKWTEATEAWSATETSVELATDGVNFYNILKWGQEESSSMFAGVKDAAVRRMLGKLHQDPLTTLMNTKIRAKLGIIPDGVTWGGQSNDVFAEQSGDFMKPVVETVDTLIKTTDLQVVVYSGQLDLIVNTLGTEEWVYTLSIAEKYRAAKRNPILDAITKYPCGFVKSVDNFSFYWILDAGHMIPADNGEAALKMLNMITNQL